MTLPPQYRRISVNFYVNLKTPFPNIHLARNLLVSVAAVAVIFAVESHDRDWWTCWWQISIWGSVRGGWGQSDSGEPCRTGGQTQGG